MRRLFIFCFLIVPFAGQAQWSGYHEIFRTTCGPVYLNYLSGETKSMNGKYKLKLNTPLKGEKCRLKISLFFTDKFGNRFSMEKTLYGNKTLEYDETIFSDIKRFEKAEFSMSGCSCGNSQSNNSSNPSVISEQRFGKGENGQQYDQNGKKVAPINSGVSNGENYGNESTNQEIQRQQEYQRKVEEQQRIKRNIDQQNQEKQQQINSQLESLQERYQSNVKAFQQFTSSILGAFEANEIKKGISAEEREIKDAFNDLENDLRSGKYELKECNDCEGSGRKRCEKCNGKGGTECIVCSGTGKAYGNKCSNCEGEGYRTCWTCYKKGTTKCYDCSGTGYKSKLVSSNIEKDAFREVNKIENSEHYTNIKLERMFLITEQSFTDILITLSKSLVGDIWNQENISGKLKYPDGTIENIQGAIIRAPSSEEPYKLRYVTIGQKEKNEENGLYELTYFNKGNSLGTIVYEVNSSSIRLIKVVDAKIIQYINFEKRPDLEIVAIDMTREKVSGVVEEQTIVCTKFKEKPSEQFNIKLV